MKQCEIEGCEKKRAAKGMCGMHYHRVKRWGDPHRVDTRGGGPIRKDLLTYTGIHSRLRRVYGPAKMHDCSNCSETAHSWAYIKEWCDDTQTQEKWVRNAAVEVEFCSDEGHYLTLCKECHIELDRNQAVFHDEYA
jgi:hypothetical protein